MPRDLGVLRERVERRSRVLRLLREYSAVLKRVFGMVTVILYGSYARGDFNVWSDVDVIVVSSVFEGVRFLRRWELLPEPPEGLEALDIIAWSPREAEAMLSKPSWRKALSGSIVIVDDYGMARRLR